MSSCWPPPPKTSESWRRSFRSRRPSSPHIPSAGARTEGSSTKSAQTGRLVSLRVSDADPTQKLGRGLKGRRRKASEGGNRGPLRWGGRAGWGYGDLRAGRSVERGSRPAWSAWSGMFEAICEGGSREEAQATDRGKTVLAAADEGGVSGNMPPRPLGES